MRAARVFTVVVFASIAVGAACATDPRELPPARDGRGVRVELTVTDPRLSIVGELIELSDTALLIATSSAENEPELLVHVPRALARGTFQGVGPTTLTGSSQANRRLRSLGRFPPGLDRPRLRAIVDALGIRSIVFLRPGRADTIAAHEAVARWPDR